MRSLDRRVIVAGIVVLAGIALVTTHSICGDSARGSEIYATNMAVAELAPVAVMAMTATVSASRDEGTEAVTAGFSEPDPASFDRAGLEIWWAKYQKAHPTR
jgi:hypothetical protein